MTQMQSILEVADNSGARKAMCIKVLGSSKQYTARIGSLIVVSIKKAIPGGKVAAGDVHLAVIVRDKVGLKRQDGSSIKFETNAVVLLNKQKEPIGTRVFGPMPRELRLKGFSKIINLAPEVL